MGSAINTFNKVTRVLRDKSAPLPQHGRSEELPTGKRDGVSWHVKAPGSGKFDKRSRQADQHAWTGQHVVDLAERRASTDALDNILSPDEIHQLASTVTNYRPLLMRVTRRILSGESHQADLPPGTDGAKLEMAAYHLALQCLSDQGDDKAQQASRTALLTPLKLVTRDPQTLAKVFQHAIAPDAEDQEELINLLIELKGAGAQIDSPQEAAESLLRPGRDGQAAIIDDTDALMAWLSGVLRLPAIKDRAHRYDTVRNALADLRATSRGAIVAKLLEQQAKAGAAAAPGPVSETSGAEDHDPDFLDRLTGLLGQFSFEQLQLALNANKRRAGEKLPQTFAEAEGPAVRNAELGDTLKELGDLHIASTLVMFVKNTLDFFRRTGRGALDGTALLRELLVCLQAPPAEAPRHYQKLLDSLGVTELVPRIVLLTNLKNVVQGLPSKCFANNEARVKAVGAIQTTMDPLVNAEEDSSEAETVDAAEAR